MCTSRKRRANGRSHALSRLGNSTGDGTALTVRNLSVEMTQRCCDAAHPGRGVCCLHGLTETLELYPITRPSTGCQQQKPNRVTSIITYHNDIGTETHLFTQKHKYTVSLSHLKKRKIMSNNISEVLIMHSGLYQHDAQYIKKHNH